MQDTILHHHHEHHSSGSDFLKGMVISMSDGLTVPFALAAGLSGAVNNTCLIVIAGLAQVAAGSIAMGLGGYLAGQTEMITIKQNSAASMMKQSVCLKGKKKK